MVFLWVLFWYFCITGVIFNVCGVLLGAYVCRHQKQMKFITSLLRNTRRVRNVRKKLDRDVQKLDRSTQK